MTDPDLQAVRTLLGPRVTGEAPTWDSIVAHLQAPARRTSPARRRRWVLAPVAAAVAVLAVTGAFVAVRHYAGPVPVPSPPVAADPSPSVGAPALDLRAVLAAARAPYPDTAVLDPATVLNGLIQNAAGTAAATIGPGQYLCARSVGRVVAVGPGGEVDDQDREAWRDPQGMVTVQLFGDGELWISDSNPAVIAERQEFAATGPTIVRPTPQYLAQLPTDPAALRTILLDGGVDNGKVSTDGIVFLQLANVLDMADLVVPPAVRVAMLRVLAAMPGLTAAQLSAEGQTLVSIRYAYTSGAMTDEMIFDPATGHMVGRGSGSPSMDATAPHRYQGFSIQKVVNTLSEHA